MSDGSLYYRHSGVVSITGLLSLLLLALPLSAVVGVAYGLGVFYVPFVKISFVITAAAGGLLGYLLGQLGVFGKIRSMAAITGVALLSGTVAWYVSWIAWLLAASEYEFLVLTPGGLLAFMQIGFHEGFWSMGSGDSAVKGYPLMGIWTIEAALIIGISVIVPYTMLADRLFCETCGKWIKGQVKLPQREPVADPAALVQALEGANFETLAAMGPRSSSKDPYTSVVIHRCDSCGDLGYLDVKSCVLVESKDGIATQTTDLVSHLVVPPALIDALKSRWEAITATDDDVPDAEPAGAE